MAEVLVTAAREVKAAPGVVYGIIADYHDGHPHILPEQYFGPLTVQRGGVGAGTRIRFTMKGLGPEREMIADVEEPEPGHILVERYPATGGTTTFLVEPAGAGSVVTFRTEWTSRGLRGWIERLLAPPFLQKVYRAELDKLQALAESRQTAAH